MWQEIQVKKCLFAPAFTASTVHHPAPPSVLSVEAKTGKMLLLPRQRHKQERNQSVRVYKVLKIKDKNI